MNSETQIKKGIETNGDILNQKFVILIELRTYCLSVDGNGVLVFCFP